MILTRSPRRSRVAPVSAEGSAIARWAVSAASAHVSSIRVTRPASSGSGQGLAVIQAAASLVAAPSSSAAARILISFAFSDAENRRSAAVTGCRAVDALMSQCCAVPSTFMPKRFLRDHPIPHRAIRTMGRTTSQHIHADPTSRLRSDRTSVVGWLCRFGSIGSVVVADALSAS